MQTSSAKDRAYTVIPYQESWIADFETIKNQLLPVFGDQAIEIMHVGSTAIVGMSGKPTIDVLVLVNDITGIDELNEAMAELGYVALGEYVAPNSRLFAREEDNERLVNIHCFERSHPHAQEMIVMRNFLQSHPDEARTYADLKIDLHRRYPEDYKEYRHFKDPYLTKMKARAIEWAESGVRPDKNNLMTIVSTFREAIEPCWSDESAYQVPEIQSYGAHMPGGQCAVTCLVLMDVLCDELPDEQIFLVSGQLQSTNGEVVIRDHGWLRVGSGTDAIIADPTADQATSIFEKVVIGTVSEFEKKGLRYIEKEVEADHGESVHPKRFKRYTILKNAWDHRDMRTHEMKLVQRPDDR